jgi:hypothetical protein
MYCIFDSLRTRLFKFLGRDLDQIFDSCLSGVSPGSNRQPEARTRINMAAAQMPSYSGYGFDWRASITSGALLSGDGKPRR